VIRTLLHELAALSLVAVGLLLPLLPVLTVWVVIGIMELANDHLPK
jgi:hypothetical protein